MQKFLRNNIYLILVVVLSIPAIAALFHFGFYGASDDLHIAWLFEMDKILKIGQIPPRFVTDLSYSFGYPLFNFVFPLPFYLGEVFHLIGFSFVDSVKTVFGISLVGSGIAMYFLLKEFLPESFSLAGALIYVYTPYRSTDIYVRGAIGEALAFVFLPILLYSVIRIYKLADRENKIDWKGASLVGLNLAALVLTHDIVSYMFFPFFLIFIIILVFFTRNKKTLLIGSLVGILGGLFVSLYFWLPAILDSKLMVYGTVFNFLDHFPTIGQLIKPYFGYGASVPGPYDLLSFFMGTLNWFLLVVGGALVFCFWKKIEKIEKAILIWSTITFLISFFMMNYRSTFLWQHLPFLPYFQFPWRFLTMTTLTSVIFLLPFKYIKFKYASYIIAGALAILAIGLNYSYFRPHDFLERTDSYYLNRYIPVPVASLDYQQTGEEYLRLPLGTAIRPNKDYPPVFSDQKLNYTVISTNGMYSKISVDLGSETAISYNKYYFSGWIAKVDGKEVSIKVGKPFGQISITVPRGKHILEFNFTETPFKKVLDIVSLASLLVVLMFLFKKNK